jgi:hypothetical protein
MYEKYIRQSVGISPIENGDTFKVVGISTNENQREANNILNNSQG